MKVLVTGASGFIGRHLIGSLLKIGHSVFASSTSALKASKFEWFPNVSFIEYRIGEAYDDRDLYSFFEEPDVLIHLAWDGLPDFKGLHHLERNLPAHLNFLGNLINNGLTDLTITGTCLEYGLVEGELNENMPSQPVVAYAVAKDRLRESIQLIGSAVALDFKWVRLFYMYGEGQHPKSLIPQLDRAIENGDLDFDMSGGEQLRDYLPVAEVGKLLCKIGLQSEVTGIINCCSGKPISVKRFVESYMSSIGSNIRLNLGVYPYPDYEPMAFWGNTGKLNTISDDDSR
ncbi:MAG TPA: NAD(P)-dependent oxidoreductase [Chryseolinea sp.]|nr:NAD(P)-dependent oxidoreductase [Chryseolinea sp.]